MTTTRKDTTFLHNRSLNLRGEIREFDQAMIMGIVNLTPDSFFDGGKLPDNKSILEKINEMLTDGADIIDIGAYSSRPGAKNISIEEETNRLIEPLRIVRKEFPEAIISIDTFRSSVARATVDLGADIVNDISGGIMDDNMMAAIADLNVPYIIMHMKGNPQNMQENTMYTDVVSDIYKFFSSQLQKASELGIKDLIIDPGFGFGKSLEDNYRLMKSLSEFRSFSALVLAGISRKSMVNKVTNTSPKDSLYGTIALNTIALLNGADILRVHDVKAAKEAVNIVSYYQNI